MVSKHHCGQTFSTYLGGREGCSPVRRGGAPREKKLVIFGRFLEVLKDRILEKYRISKNWELYDRETRLFGAVSSRGED